MNSKILQKCIDELSKDSPKLDYVRGILETLVEQEGTPVGIGGYGVSNTIQPVPAGSVISAADQAAKLAEQGFIKGVKPMQVTETNTTLG